MTTNTDAVPTIRDSIAKEIHYPACWDTAAYPTLEDAMLEMVCAKRFVCSECALLSASKPAAAQSYHNDTPEHRAARQAVGIEATDSPIGDMIGDLQAEQSFISSDRERCHPEYELPRWDRIQRVIDYLAASPAAPAMSSAKLIEILDWIVGMSTDAPITNMARRALELVKGEAVEPAQSGEAVTHYIGGRMVRHVQTPQGMTIRFETEEPGVSRVIVEAAEQQPSKPAKSGETVGKNALVLSAAQLLEALDFIAPDRASDAEQLENEIAIEHGEGYAGKATYCWCAEYPEEGSWVLDGKSVLAAPQPAQTERVLTGEQIAALRVAGDCLIERYAAPIREILENSAQPIREGGK